MSDKQFQLTEALCEIDGVSAAEAYKKSTGENVWDVLVKTENGHLVEGRISTQGCLKKLHAYISTVIELGDSNFRNYPDFESKDEQN